MRSPSLVFCLHASNIKEAVSKEPEIEVKLCTLTNTNKARVKYDFKTGQYEPIPDEELLEDLLTLPSKTILKEELYRLEEEKRRKGMHGFIYVCMQSMVFLRRK